MQWNSLDAFLAMGGYGEYIWGAYGLTALLMLIELIAVRRRYRQARTNLKNAASSD
jgi:heme exporter protein D